jgi:hypothetical protein
MCIIRIMGNLRWWRMHNNECSVSCVLWFAKFGHVTAVQHEFYHVCVVFEAPK